MNSPLPPSHNKYLLNNYYISDSKLGVRKQQTLGEGGIIACMGESVAALRIRPTARAREVGGGNDSGQFIFEKLKEN